MTTLYDYGTELADTVEQVQDLLSEGVDPNDEIVQELLEKMVAQEEDWENKAINVGKFLNQLSLDEKQVEAEIERLTKKKKSLSNAFASLHDLLLWQMEEFGKDEIKNPLLTIKVRENPLSVVIKNEDAVPAQYKSEKTTITVNKNAIKLAYKDGAAIDGVEFIRTKKLTIK